MSSPTAQFKKLFPSGLLEKIGVTRIARVTELDHLGLEVACAVRPEGHVLQVSQGKGRTFEDAARSAVFEAAELWAAEHPSVSTFVWASTRELRSDGEVWAPTRFPDSAVDLFHDDLELPWVKAQRLDARGSVWVPAQNVYCPGPEGADVGLLLSRWTSNAMGAHQKKQSALKHAQFELWERHSLALTLPFGWDPRQVKGLRVPAVGWAADQLLSQGAEVAVFDLSWGKTGLATAGALVRDRSGRAVSLTAGYASRVRLQDAIDAAVAEAAQSRLTDIHGAREDVDHAGPDAAAADVFFKMPVTKRSAARGAAPRGSLTAELQVAMVELEIPDIDVHVVKLVSPDAQLSELLS